jgi:hypothetical protein
MHAIPRDTDLSFLTAGGDLIQVCFSLYQVILRFSEDDTVIDIEGPAEIRSGDVIVSSWRSDEISDMTGFAKLLNSKIVGFQVDDTDRIHLAFGNGLILTLKSELGPYESMSLKNNREGFLF